MTIGFGVGSFWLALEHWSFLYLVSTIYIHSKIHACIELPCTLKKPTFFQQISEISSKDWNSNLNWSSSDGWWNLPIGIGFIFMIIFALYKLLDQEFSIREKCKAAHFAQKHQLEKTHGKGNIFILQIKQCISYLQIKWTTHENAPNDSQELSTDKPPCTPNEPSTNT